MAGHSAAVPSTATATLSEPLLAGVKMSSAAGLRAAGPPPVDPPRVVAMPWDGDSWAVVVAPGSASSDLAAAVACLPTGLRFAESFGDVDVVLVYGRSGEVVDHAARAVS